jgi:hypothetical protein
VRYSHGRDRDASTLLSSGNRDLSRRKPLRRWLARAHRYTADISLWQARRSCTDSAGRRSPRILQRHRSAASTAPHPARNTVRQCLGRHSRERNPFRTRNHHDRIGTAVRRHSRFASVLHAPSQLHRQDACSRVIRLVSQARQFSSGGQPLNHLLRAGVQSLSCDSSVDPRTSS